MLAALQEVTAPPPGSSSSSEGTPGVFVPSTAPPAGGGLIPFSNLGGNSGDSFPYGKVLGSVFGFIVLLMLIGALVCMCWPAARAMLRCCRGGKRSEARQVCLHYLKFLQSVRRCVCGKM